MHEYIRFLLISFAQKPTSAVRFCCGFSHLFVIDFMLSVRHQVLPGAASSYAAHRSPPFHPISIETYRNAMHVERIEALGRRHALYFWIAHRCMSQGEFDIP